MDLFGFLDNFDLPAPHPQPKRFAIFLLHPGWPKGRPRCTLRRSAPVPAPSSVDSTRSTNSPAYGSAEPPTTTALLPSDDSVATSSHPPFLRSARQDSHTSRCLNVSGHDPEMLVALHRERLYDLRRHRPIRIGPLFLPATHIEGSRQPLHEGRQLADRTPATKAGASR